ncbi:hypothetical protein C8R45DRAFT_931191 [Mycena sanguinolenta]|nr:hypothetical protein C8R45DRAFT_931191 [Mycena sanguinolenta]
MSIIVTKYALSSRQTLSKSTGDVRVRLAHAVSRCFNPSLPDALVGLDIGRFRKGPHALSTYPAAESRAVNAVVEYLVDIATRRQDDTTASACPPLLCTQRPWSSIHSSIYAPTCARNTYATRQNSVGRGAGESSGGDDRFGEHSRRVEWERSSWLGCCRVEWDPCGEEKEVLVGRVGVLAPDMIIAPLRAVRPGRVLHRERDGKSRNSCS